MRGVVKNYIFGRTGRANTFIGGIGGTVTSASALASVLSISSSLISDFNIVNGVDIECGISGNYNLTSPSFRDDMNLKYYVDAAGRMKELQNATCLRNTGSTNFQLWGLTHITHSGALGYNDFLTELFLPSLIHMAPQGVRRNTAATHITIPVLEQINGNISNCFEGLLACEELDIRKLKVYGSDPTVSGSTVSGFGSLKTNCIIKVHQDLATANSGAPHGALVWVKANRSAIVEFYDDAGNYVSTL